MIDCFDGMVTTWTISTSQNAELVNLMLDKVIDNLSEEEHPIIHSDRGCHYIWPWWIKGYSPDNSACEGFFGRLKNEMFYKRNCNSISINKFMDIVNNYIEWYNNKRIKQSLGYKSPVEYRKELGLI